MKLLFTIWVIFFLMACSVSAQASDGFFCPRHIPHTYTRSLKENDTRLGLIHGYYPHELTDDTGSRFSTTAEEQGHYILGDSEQTFRYDPTVTITNRPLEEDPTKVLVSAQPRQILREDIAFRVGPKSTADRPPRINDSLDIPRVIEEHRWIIPDLSKRI